MAATAAKLREAHGTWTAGRDAFVSYIVDRYHLAKDSESWPEQRKQIVNLYEKATRATVKASSAAIGGPSRAVSPYAHIPPGLRGWHRRQDQKMIEWEKKVGWAAKKMKPDKSNAQALVRYLATNYPQPAGRIPSGLSKSARAFIEEHLGVKVLDREGRLSAGYVFRPPHMRPDGTLTGDPESLFAGTKASRPRVQRTRSR